MARIEDLVSEISDIRLREDISREIARLKDSKRFGLVFEQHLPETIRVFSLAPRVGDFITPRMRGANQLWRVSSVSNRAIHARLEGTNESLAFNRRDVVVIKRFGEPIYPALVPVERLEMDSRKTWHALIQADNFHALQLLCYAYERSVDVIYIDPPYNTGAKDWKYNNDYVDANDLWRHSKWLSFMQRRLLLAKRLLSDSGCMICSIDENEQETLGLLLKETFPAHEVVCVTVVHNPRGIQGDNFSYCHEYAYFVLPRGKGRVVPRAIDAEETNLRKWGGQSRREDGRNLFYPIYVREGRILRAGSVPPDDHHPATSHRTLKGGEIEIWPIDKNGIERKWRYAANRIDDISEQLTVVDSATGPQILIRKTEGQYKTVWQDPKYDAGTHGSRLVKGILGREFPYPKSLYTVEECLRSVCRDKKDAVVLDFFAGSGTTFHAVCLLNAEDGGQRRCISVTNNEVSETLAQEMAARGVSEGDDEYERAGICRSITWPRSKAVLSGVDGKGARLRGEYINGRFLGDGFRENLEYFKLEFLDSDAVAKGAAFSALLPMLWMMAGCVGPREDVKSADAWILPEKNPFAVLLRERQFLEFRKRLGSRPDITHVFLVTDSEEMFREMLLRLPGRRVFMLYKSYLENFRFGASNDA